MARRPLHPDDLWLLKVTGDARWSPDGTRVAYVVTSHERDGDRSAQSIWMAAVDGASPPTLFAHGPSTHSPRFSPDGRHLAFVSDRGDGPQLHLAPLAGGEPVAVTDLAHGVSAPAWSPDSSRIAFVAKVGEAHDPGQPRVVRSLRSRVDGAGWLDGRRSHVFVLDVASGRCTQVTDGDWDDDQPAWSPDGSTLVFVSDRGDARFDRSFHRDAWTVPAKGGKARRVTRGQGDAMNPAFSPRGDRIAYLGGEDGDAVWSRPTHVLVVDAEGATAPRSLTAAHDVHAGSRFLITGQLAWESERSLLFLGPNRGGVSLFRVDDRGRAVSEVVAGDRAVTGFDRSAGGRLAFSSTWVSEPSEIWVTAAGGEAPIERLSDANGELRRTVTLAKAKRVRSTSPDGTVVESFVVRPPGVPADAKTSLVLDIHGGPHGWNPGTSVGGWMAVQAAAGAGHTVVLPNPRGSAGYGRDFLAACVGEWGGGDADDLLAAVDTLIAKGVVSKSRQYVWGYSFGGFMASWLIGHTKRFRAAVIGAPVVNQVSMLGTTDIPAFSIHETGGLPWERPDEYAKRSPLTYAPDISTPALILHHEGDLRCPVGQGEELFVALRLHGVEAEMVRYPGGFHGIAKPSFVADRTARLLAWFAAH